VHMGSGWARRVRRRLVVGTRRTRYGDPDPGQATKRRAAGGAHPARSGEQTGSGLRTDGELALASRSRRIRQADPRLRRLCRGGPPRRIPRVPRIRSRRVLRRRGRTAGARPGGSRLGTVLRARTRRTSPSVTLAQQTTGPCGTDPEEPAAHRDDAATVDRRTESVVAHAAVRRRRAARAPGGRTAPTQCLDRTPGGPSGGRASPHPPGDLAGRPTSVSIRYDDARGGPGGPAPNRRPGRTPDVEPGLRSSRPRTSLWGR
jgi:hypothetical protein